MGLVYTTRKATDINDKLKVIAAYTRRTEKHNNKINKVNFSLRIEEDTYKRIKSFNSSENACINALLIYALDNLEASNCHLIAWQPSEDE